MCFWNVIYAVCDLAVVGGTHSRWGVQRPLLVFRSQKAAVVLAAAALTVFGVKAYNDKRNGQPEEETKSNVKQVGATYSLKYRPCSISWINSSADGWFDGHMGHSVTRRYTFNRPLLPCPILQILFDPFVSSAFYQLCLVNESSFQLPAGQEQSQGHL